jgi:hypothetical protein
MMFMLNGKFANKYFCGMCGMTEDPEESEFYSKHGDQLRSLDDDDDSGNSNGNIIGSKYDEMIVQSRGDYSSSFSQASERQPQMTNQRRKQSSTYGLPQNENNNDDWAVKELRRDLEANGSYQVVKIMDNIDNNIITTTGNEKYHSRINRIETSK